MRYRLLNSLAALAAVAAIFAFAVPAMKAQSAKSAPATRTWTQPKTPWGDPDIQGTWTSDDCIGTPMNRPAQFGDRLYYTEQELATRQATLSKQLENDLVDTVGPNAR